MMTTSLIDHLRRSALARTLRRRLGPKSRARITALALQISHAIQRAKPANRAHDARQRAILDRYKSTCAQPPLVSTSPDP